MKMKMKAMIKKTSMSAIALLSGVVILTCEPAPAGEPDENYGNTNTGGNSGNSGSSGSSGNNSSRTCNWSAECLTVTIGESPCYGTGIEWIVTNICNKPLKINFRYQIPNGNWVVLASTDPVQPGKKMGGTYSCSTTGNYRALAMPYDEWLANKCSTPDVDGNDSSGGSSGSGSGSSGGTTSNYGSITFWTASDKGCGSINITVTGVGSGTLSKYISSGTPDCGANGTVTFSNVKYGSYNWKATCGSHTWQGTVNFAHNCYKIKLN
jgi:hypothetical protein